MSHGTVDLQIEQLQAEREQTLLKLARLHEALKLAIDPDTDDGASDLEEHDNALALIPDLEHKLKAIDRAIQRAQQGSYGICEHCGATIDPARLEAMPETTFCMPCKLLIERKSRLALQDRRPGNSSLETYSED